MKDKNRQFEETGAFLDLMSKREKKRWEKEQKRINEQEHNDDNTAVNVNEDNTVVNVNESQVTNEVIAETEINNSSNENTNLEEEPKENIHNESPQLEENKKVEQQKEDELEKTKKILEVTTEINTVNSINDEDSNTELDEDDTSGGFNPVIPIGISLIFIYAFFIYITVATDFTHNTFLTVNIVILSILTLFFGLTTLSNKKHVNVFAIFDLIIILSYILFNGISLISYDDMYKDKKDENKVITEEKEEKPIVEKEPEQIEKHIYNCENENSTINITYNTENKYVTYIKRNEVLANTEIADEISSYYKNINGITVEVDDKEITIEFDFNALDINQYKIAVTKHNDSYRLESDFSYIEENKILTEKYQNLELKNLTCTEIKR